MLLGIERVGAKTGDPRYATYIKKSIDSLVICKVAGLGGNPPRDGSYAYYVSEPVVSNDYKGVAPFVLAAVELGK